MVTGQSLQTGVQLAQPESGHLERNTSFQYRTGTELLLSTHIANFLGASEVTACGEMAQSRAELQLWHG